MLAEAVEIAPGVDAGVVHVVELDPDRVIADRLDRHDADMAAAGDQLLLARPVALHFSRRTLDPQQLGRKAELGAVVEIDLQRLLGLLQPDLDRPDLANPWNFEAHQARISSSVSCRAS